MSKFISNIKKSVEACIVGGRTGKAIDILLEEMDKFDKETADDIAMIAHRYEVIERANRRGTILFIDYETKLNGIAEAVLNQLKVIETEIKKIFFGLFIK